jgi:stage V sporulation protein G
VEITEVRIKLMDDPHDRLQAFCSITFDGSFVIRDLKIIQGTKGSFVAMPSRKLTDRCPRCHSKNNLRSLYCSQCGAKLDEERATKSDAGRAKLYADIAHPINSHCREMIQNRVLVEYESEIIRAQQPDYTCTYDDYGEETYAVLAEEETPIAPTFVSDSNDNLHRIEPAADSPRPPHHTLANPSSTSNPVAAPAGQPHNPDDEDTFGTGLL